MSRKKRGINVFNENLQAKYNFIQKTKSDSDVLCTVCKTAFNLSHGGKSDIESHIKSSHHKQALSAASFSNSMTKYYSSDKLSKSDLEIAACEGVWAYHVIRSNHSFRSADCASKIIRSCFGLQKFTCARTKCESIATGVIAPYVFRELQRNLNDSQFVTLITDASNNGNIKMFPVLVRYFSENEGVKVKIIQLTSECGESSNVIVALLNGAVDKFGLNSKIVAFCGDNAPCNFGNRARSGSDNTCYKLNQLYPGLIGVGCAAHIVHNTLKKACDQMPFDIECIVVKIYSHFYLYTVRVTKLKEFCASVEVEYKKLLGYTKTRFLALLSAVDSILRIFEGLKEYFLNDGSSPLLLKKFFKEPMSKIWLLFLRDQATIFNRTVKLIESDSISAIEVGNSLNVFVEMLSSRQRNSYLSIAVQNEIKRAAIDDDTITNERLLIIARSFYEECVQYLQNWIVHFDHLSVFAWAVLDQPPEWQHIEASAQFIALKNRLDIETCDTELFDQFTYLTKYVTAEKIEMWKDKNIAIDQRWVDGFQHLAKKHIPYNHLLKIMGYILCLPGTSATVERIFSLINEIWSKEKSQLSIATLRDILYVRYNIEMSFLEFFDFLKGQPKMLKEISCDGKYAFKNNTKNV